MPFSRTLSVVGCHAEGEVGDVIVGGVLDVPAKTMFEKMMHFWTKQDEIRNLLLNEPRGRSSMSKYACMHASSLGLGDVSHQRSS